LRETDTGPWPLFERGVAKARYKIANQQNRARARARAVFPAKQDHFAIDIVFFDKQRRWRVVRKPFRHHRRHRK